MTPCDLVLATALLTAPLGTIESRPTAEHWPRAQAAIHEIAVTWELLDPREVRYVMSRPEDFETDLELLRRRHLELHDAPKIADAGRLPDRQTVNELLRFNREYRKHLEARLAWEVDRSHILRQALCETDRGYRIWDAIRDARCEFYYITIRRQALKKLRDLIGNDAYDTCDLPPSVPEWRFTEVR